jgi:hypothetical protein
LLRVSIDSRASFGAVLLHCSIPLARAEALRADADVETTPSNTKHAGFYSKPENSIDHQPGAMAVARITSTSIATVSEKDHRRYIQTPVPSLDHVYRQIDAWLAIPGVQGRIDEAFWPILGEVLLRPGGPLDDITKPPAWSSVGTKRSTPQSTSATRASTPECQVTRTTFNRKKRSWHQQTASAAPDIVAGLTQSKQARVYPPDNVRRERVAKDKTGRSGSIGDDTDVEPKLDVDNPNYARLAYGQMTQLVMAEHTRIRQECDQLVAQLHQLRSLFISALHSMREEQDDDMASPMADTLFGPINVKCPILPLATSVWSATGPSSWKVLGSFMDQVVQQTKALHRKRAPLKEECRRLQVAWMQFQSDHDQWQTECKHRTQETRKGNAKDRTRRFKV